MNLIIMGAPGSGKGTCCAELKLALNVPHISTGDMFRKAIKEQTPLGKIAKEIIDSGNFVPDNITNGLVEERLQCEDCKNGFILDGYPRNINQAIEFDNILNRLNIKLDAAINFNIDDNVLIERIVNRRVCPTCGAGYNVISLKPQVEGICDKCGSTLITRADDTVETVKTRLDVYAKQTKPLIDFYNNKNLLLDVDASGSIDQVLKATIGALNK